MKISKHDLLGTLQLIFLCKNYDSTIYGFTVASVGLEITTGCLVREGMY
jgi:hypothetical protein